MLPSNLRPGCAKRFQSALGVAVVSALPLLASVSAMARNEDQRERAGDATWRCARTAPKQPSLAPLFAVGMGVLLAAGLSLGKPSLSRGLRSASVRSASPE
jgi:hypothetical protein